MRAKWSERPDSQKLEPVIGVRAARGRPGYQHGNVTGARRARAATRRVKSRQFSGSSSKLDGPDAVGEGQPLADRRRRGSRRRSTRRLEARDHARRGPAARRHEHRRARHGLERVLDHRAAASAAVRRRRHARPRAGSSLQPRVGRRASVAAAILASIVTASSGNLPIADSPESMTQSVPSRIALATSVASARVGRRLATIDSSICVAGDDRLAGRGWPWR